MQLFIANLTNQHRDFTYRIPGEVNYRTEHIAIGKQTRLPAELTSEELAGIIKQYEPYGMVAANQLKNIREFVGLCYSIDKPVPMDNMIHTFDHNTEALNDKAVDRREQTAAAIAAGITNKMHDHDVTVARTEVEFTEATDGTGKVAEGYEIPAEGVQPRKSNKLGRRGREARA